MKKTDKKKENEKEIERIFGCIDWVSIFRHAQIEIKTIYFKLMWHDLFA